METDLIGIYPVAQYIEDSGCSKFKIYRGKSSTGVTPIFQSDESKNNKEAVYNFKKWATNSLQNNANGNIYELKVYSKDEGENYKGAIQFSLIAQNLGVLNGADNSNLSEERISKAISEGVRLATLEIELKQLKQDYEDLNKEIDEEDKEEKPNQLIDALGKLAGLIGVVIPKNNNEVALSGVENNEQTATKKLTKEQCVNINSAVQILFLADNNIDKSLLKLADISQKNKSQFTFLLNALNNM